MKNNLITAGLLLMAVLTGCTFTTTVLKQPSFTVSTDSLGMQLNKLVQCENFNLNGAEITTNGQKETVLEIDVINGNNIPQEDEAMYALAKKIAVQVKEDMADTNAYNSYKVLFVTQTVHGITTKRIERGQVFKNEALKTSSQPARVV
ncbi:MAG TPA: hypothetical protein VHB48_16000 [Chitinophagaceae bacterium]|nr:hypothetical protein [Chitinophagaceae bacterium]